MSVPLKDFEVMQKRYESACIEIKRLTAQLEDAKRIIDILEREKKQHNEQQKLQDKIIQQTIDQANERNNQTLKENQQLKQRIGELANGNIN